MKRSISLILLTAVCALALAAVTTLGGCAATPTGERWKQKMFGGGDEGDK